MFLSSCFVSLILLASKIRGDKNSQDKAPTILEEQLVPGINCTDQTKSSLILVSTIDGSISAINANTGEVKWNFLLDGPLLSSSISSLKKHSEFGSGSNIHFIPSLDGQLYQWTGTKLESVPLSADYLLGQMERLSDGSFIIGGKQVSISGVDMDSGKLCYECSALGCRPALESDVSEKNLLLLRREQQTVRVIDQRSGTERWNFSVGSYALEYIGESPQKLTPTIPSKKPEGNFCHPVTHSSSVRFIVQDGVVESSENNSEKDSSPPWHVQLKSPITAAWQLEDGELQSLDIFTNGVLRGMPSDKHDHPFVYMGNYHDQMYIQTSRYARDQHRRKLAQNLFSADGHLLTTDASVSQWRPYISSSPSRSPSLQTSQNHGLVLYSRVDYPFDGMLLVPSPSTHKPSKIYLDTDQSDTSSSDDDTVEDSTCGDGAGILQESRRTGKCTQREDQSGASASVKKVPQSTLVDSNFVPLTLIDGMGIWWKEIIGLSLLIAVGMNVAVRVLKRRFGISRNLLELALVECAEEEEGECAEVEEEVVIKPLRNRTRVSTATETESTILVLSDSPDNSPREFVSSYMRDFDHAECLGAGGFGVVFRSRKRIDDCEYAVKRICLPHCAEAKEKMMREVRALAALDHPGIVRYFHAWWENPPTGWQVDTDKALLLRDAPTQPSFVLSSDWLLEVDSEISDDSHQQKKPLQRRHNDSSAGDPLGKRFNFDTGVEDELVPDHADFDLFKNNDVFFTDELSPKMFMIGDDVEEIDEDSFVIFESSGCQAENSDGSIMFVNDDDIDESHCNVTVGDSDSSGFDATHEVSESIDKKQFEDSCYSSESKGCIPHLKYAPELMRLHSEDLQKSGKTKLVGKCCSKSEVCVTAPPVFLYIQMQLCKQQTLKDWLNDSRANVNFSERMSIFLQIVNAVVYFHGKGMMHRDLKPANIFFSLDGSVKVGDFGLVTAITRPSIGNYKGRTFQDENHTGQVGTQLYMSPEQIYGKPYCYKVDIYSLGLILFEMLYSFSTQMERIQVMYKLRRQVLPPSLDGTPEGNLINLLLSEHPDNRPEANAIASHEYMRQILERRGIGVSVIV